MLYFMTFCDTWSGIKRALCLLLAEVAENEGHYSLYRMHMKQNKAASIPLHEAF
jgi:hypothetical protein